jgi:hypothetical protein
MAGKNCCWKVAYSIATPSDMEQITCLTMLPPPIASQPMPSLSIWEPRIIVYNTQHLRHSSGFSKRFIIRNSGTAWFWRLKKGCIVLNLHMVNIFQRVNRGVQCLPWSSVSLTFDFAIVSEQLGHWLSDILYLFCDLKC